MGQTYKHISQCGYSVRIRFLAMSESGMALGHFALRYMYQFIKLEIMLMPAVLLQRLSLSLRIN